MAEHKHDWKFNPKAKLPMNIKGSVAGKTYTCYCGAVQLRGGK